MAWIEFHSNRIKKLKKFGDLRRSLQWSAHETLGFLGSLWGEALDVAESGEISGWTPEYLCELTGVSLDPKRVWDALVVTGWLDEVNEKVLIHDWPDWAGRYLESKYRTSSPDLLAQIWTLHGRIWRESDHRRTKDGPPVLPDRTKPNPKKPAPSGASADDQKWPLESLRRVVNGWKVQSGNAEDDKAWDRVYYPRCLPYAKELLTLFNGDVDAVLDCIQERWELIKDKKGFDLSLAGVVKGAVVFRQKWLEGKSKREGALN